MDFIERILILSGIRILGHSWYGVLCWGMGIIITFFYFMKHAGKWYAEALNAFFCNFALLWFIDLVSIPYNILLYGIQIYYTTPWVGFERWFFIFACLTIFYHNRRKFHMDKLVYIVSFYSLSAFISLLTFGTVGLAHGSPFSVAMYFLFIFVPFWTTYPVIMLKFIRRQH